MTAQRAESHEANWGEVRAVHPVWCTERGDNHGDECNGDTETLAGVNLGTEVHLWLTTEPGGWGRPVAQLELTKEMSYPASGVYLDAAGLRALAAVATKRAEQLEGGEQE